MVLQTVDVTAIVYTVVKPRATDCLASSFPGKLGLG
jgi:hypothetical protein